MSKPDDQINKLVATVKDALSKDGFKFRTKYGQTATMYWLSNPKMAKIAKACKKPADPFYALDLNGWPYSIAVEIQVDKTLIYAVHCQQWRIWEAFELWSAVKAGKVGFWPISEAKLVVYNQVARPAHAREGRILIRSIVKNIPPEVCAVLS